MNTNLSNLSSWDLRELALGNGTIAECARRVLAERDEEGRRLTEIINKVAAERAARADAE